jgi:hypothetical protein
MAAEAKPDRAAGSGAGVDPLARIVFLVLVLACLGAFFLTQRLKHTPTALQRFELTPTFSPYGPRARDRQERISFKLAHAEAVTVTIINSSGDVIATLVRGYPVPRYKQFSLRWNGRRGIARRFEHLTAANGHKTLVPVNGGRLAPAGEYRVMVSLSREGREISSPRSFSLVGP